MWRRRWVWRAVGVVAVAGIVAGAMAAVHAHGVSTRKAREQKDVAGYLNAFRLHLPQDRTPIPPDAIVIFSSMQNDLNNFKNLSPAQAERQALLDQARSLTNRSGALFDRGYAKIVRMANRLGLPIKTTVQPAPQAPQGSPTPTPSATASPSASPSA